MPPKKKDKNHLLEKDKSKTAYGAGPRKKIVKKKTNTTTNKNTNKINNTNKIVVNVNTQSKRRTTTRTKPKQSLYDKLESQRGQLRQQQTYTPPPVIYMQPLQEGSKNPNRLIEKLEKDIEILRNHREENQTAQEPVKARKVRSDKGVARGSKFGPDVYPQPLLNDAIGTRLNQKKNPSAGGYQSDDDRSAHGQRTIEQLFSPAMTRSRSRSAAEN